MKINIRDILSSHGLSEKVVCEDSTPIEGIVLKAPVKVDLKLTNIGEQSLLISGTLQTSVELVCSRCACEYDEPLSVEVSERFVPAGCEELQDDEEEVSADDLCVFTYDNNEIELADVLSQNLLASLPYRPLCRPDCRGLCGECGANLNEKPCGCVPEPDVDPRWEALQKFSSGS